MSGTLAELVTGAVAELLDGRAQISYDEVIAGLPVHLLRAQPSKRLVAGAIKAAGWRAVRQGDQGVVYRASGADPLRAHGEAGDNIAAEQLRQFIERIERLEEEKKSFADDISDVYSEAKGSGFDAKTMRAVVKLRKMEKHHRDEADALLEMYRAALGMG